MNRFAAFLRDFDGRLPRPWVLEPQTGDVPARRGTTAGFRVEPARHAAPAPAPAAAAASRRAALPGHVPGAARRPDRRGCALPAGRYRITLRRGGPPELRAERAATWRGSCAARADGCPSPWRVDPATGTFTQGPGTGFRIKPIGLVR